MAAAVTYRYDLYGSTALELEDLEALVAERLGLEFSAHDSSYWGPYSSWSASPGEQIRITTNFVDEDGELLEEDFPAYRSFVYVSESRRPDEIDRQLRGIAGVEHLRTKRVER